jgi:hypothetical protein
MPCPARGSRHQNHLSTLRAINPLTLTRLAFVVMPRVLRLRSLRACRGFRNVLLR